MVTGAPLASGNEILAARSLGAASGSWGQRESAPFGGVRLGFAGVRVMQRPAGSASARGVAVTAAAAIAAGCAGIVTEDGSFARDGVGSSTGRSQAARSKAAAQIAALETFAVEKSWGRPRMPRSYHDARRGGALRDGLDRGLGRSQNVAALRHPTSTVVPASLVFAFALAACKAGPPEPTPEPSRNSPEQTQGGAKTPAARLPDDAQRTAPIKPMAPPKRKVAAKPTATVAVSPDDPIKGKWSLDEATKGLPAGKQIIATIETDLGNLECKLFDDKAPITVANFVGLARGTRPWKTPEGSWEKKPAYDGTPFHRIIKGFMIQGGDAKKNGSGEAGYVIPDEIWDDANHDRAGLLCMANRGPNTSSAQFFITDAAAAHLDNGYTIFGECGPEELVHKIASVEVSGERPKSIPVIKKVTITRK